MLVLLFIGLWAVQAAFIDSVGGSGDLDTIDNETFQNPTAGELIELSESNRAEVVYDENVTVYDENDTVMTNGSDYTWFVKNGTLLVESGGDLAGDNNGSITYQFREPTDTQAYLKELALIPFALGEGIMIVLGAAFAFAGLLILAQRA